MRCWPSSLLLVTACQAPTTPWRLADVAAPLVVHVTTDRRLEVQPSRGVRLNAALPPTLEFDDGRIQPLADGARTADGAYFAGAASGPVPDRMARRIRVSWCNTGEALCRVRAFPLAGAD